MSSKNNSTKSGNVKSVNKKTLLVVISCIAISISFLSVLTFIGEPSVNLPEPFLNMDEIIQNLSDSHTINVQSTSNFHLYVTPSDFERLQNDLPIMNGIRLTLNESISKDFIDEFKSNANAVVIYPIFTAAAYQVDGFYSYYLGYCDESCITNLSFETFNFDYGGSGATSQILYHFGYNFLTDIEVDQNPGILDNYETVILLHNEYVTKKEFDAISTHPNLIFIHPNALYAEINVNYDDNTMTLIRGHNYPEPEIANGFDYAIEEKFHEYEYETECTNWEFIEIENGFHLNCYPEAIIIKNLEIIKKLSELLSN